MIKLEPLRQQKIKEGLKKLLEEHVGKENYDTNRLEQEIIYYIEKIDISEEQVRLKNHCDYFKTILNEPEEGKGKKLSFILQEIGREINTTGSKAYDSYYPKMRGDDEGRIGKSKRTGVECAVRRGKLRLRLSGRQYLRFNNQFSIFKEISGLINFESAKQKLFTMIKTFISLLVLSSPTFTSYSCLPAPDHRCFRKKCCDSTTAMGKQF